MRTYVQPRSVMRGRAARGRERTVDWSIIAATIALLALIGSNIIGTASAGVFILASGALFFTAPLDAGRRLMRFSPLLILPVFALVSAAWSDSPERTVRAGLQIVATMAAAILVCATLPRDRLITILFIGIAGIALLALPYIPRVLLTGAPLAGPFGSKNSMAFAGLVLFALSLTMIFDGKRPRLLRLAAIGTILYGLLVIMLARSGGVFALLGLTAGLFPLFLIFARFNFPMRVFLVLLALSFIAVAIVFLPELEAAGDMFREGVLKKDATLTGRTYLWDFAFRLSAERPWFGHGYYAFWRIGNIDAEGLWRMSGITKRTGFNFHNSFVEMLVDLGRVGVLVLAATCAAIVLAAFLRQVRSPSIAMTFLLTMTVVQLVRSYAETVLFAPFTLETLLLVATAVYAFPRDPNDIEAVGVTRNRTRMARTPR